MSDPAFPQSNAGTRELELDLEATRRDLVSSQHASASAKQEVVRLRSELEGFSPAGGGGGGGREEARARRCVEAELRKQISSRDDALSEARGRERGLEVTVHRLQKEVLSLKTDVEASEGEADAAREEAAEGRRVARGLREEMARLRADSEAHNLGMQGALSKLNR